jgi:outer membrane protein assembly factor BamE
MLSKLEIGLTKAQVRYIMGTPAVIDPFDMNRWDYIGFQIVGDEKSAVVHHIVIFKDNKLVEWKSNNENEVNENLKEKSMLESIKKPEK